MEMNTLVHYQSNGVEVADFVGQLPRTIKTAGQRKQYLIRLLAQRGAETGWYSLNTTSLVSNEEEITKIYFRKR